MWQRVRISFVKKVLFKITGLSAAIVFFQCKNEGDFLSTRMSLVLYKILFQRLPQSLNLIKGFRTTFLFLFDGAFASIMQLQ